MQHRDDALCVKLRGGFSKNSSALKNLPNPEKYAATRTLRVPQMRRQCAQRVHLQINVS